MRSGDTKRKPSKPKAQEREWEAFGNCCDCGREGPLVEVRKPHWKTAGLTTPWVCVRCRALVMLALKVTDAIAN